MAVAWVDRATDSTSGWVPGAIAWSPDLAIFCAAGGIPSASTSFATSADGITWTGFAPGGGTGLWGTGLVWTGSQFVALGTQTTDQCVQTSPDGEVWTQQTAQQRQGAGSWSGICYSPDLNLLVVVGTNDVMTSTDGVTWTSRTDPGAGWECVAWSPDLGIFCALSRSSLDVTNVMTSTDGITWNGAAASGLTFRGYSDICWSPALGLFCAVHSTNSLLENVATSPDGTTWTARTTPAGEWEGVCWSPELELFVAVANEDAAGGAGFRAMHSTDGATWTADATTSELNWTKVAWSPDLELFAAVASTGNLTNIMTGVYSNAASISPSRGTKRGGTVCTISGVGLSGTTAVTFGGTAATSVVAAADGLSVTCISPTHAVGAVDVVLT